MEKVSGVWLSKVIFWLWMSCVSLLGVKCVLLFGIISFLL